MSLLDLEFDLPKQRAMPSFDEITAACRPLIDMGAALHWLKPKSKAPIENSWSTAPVYSFEQLRESYREGNNVGIRLGEPSLTPYGYLHVFDMDIRSDQLEAEAWQHLVDLIPGARTLPSVVSGSGGCSRHIWFVHHKPLKSEKLFKSSTFKMVFDANLNREVKKNDYEIELFGTGKQVVLPPSIHPNTGKPYFWKRPILIDLGVIPYVSTDFSDYSPELDEDDDGFGAAVRSAPLADLTEEKIDEIMGNLPADWVDDYEHWRTAGMALDHQYEGSQAGFDRWVEWSKQSDKFDMKALKVRWKSFKEKSHPVTMRTLIAASKEAMVQAKMPAIVEEKPVYIDPLDSLIGGPTSQPVIPKSDKEWMKRFDVNKERLPKSCLLNTQLVLRHDIRSYGVLGFNEFKQEIVRISAPKIAKLKDSAMDAIQLDGGIWGVPDPMNGGEWTSTHESMLRMMIEAPKSQGGYGFSVSDRDLRAAIDIVAAGNSYHPVKQYLLACKWDGIPRASTLFVDFLGCEDTPYHRECAELFLLGAVTRIFEPGHKFDFLPILEGFQGKRKSTFISILGRGWFSELSADLEKNQDMVNDVLGTWIMEIPELQQFSRTDANTLKAWVTKTHDKVRLSYERRARTFPRQVVFMGSTNDDAYLRDHTGGRRFWPIKTGLKGEIDTDRLEAEIDQIWAETLLRYQSLREQIKLKHLPLYLQSEEAQVEAKVLQDSRRVETIEDNQAGRIEKWLNEPIGTAEGADDLDPNAPPVYRNATCVLDVWVSMMGKDPDNMQQGDKTKIGGALARIPGWFKTRRQTTKKYGPQFVHVRVGSDPHDREL